MPDFIVIRLHPPSPKTGEEFAAYLTGLDIVAYDLSVADSGTGTRLGEANACWLPVIGFQDEPFMPIPVGTPIGIVQHFAEIKIEEAGNTKYLVTPLAVATALIPLRAHAEYQSSDVRLVMTQSGKPVVYDDLNFNVGSGSLAGQPGVDDIDAQAVMDLSASSCFFVTLPDPAVSLDPNAAYVDLPADGSAPPYDAVHKAVNLVLAGDPGGQTLETRGRALLEAEARQVAREIVWNRTVPPTPMPQGFPLETLYTTQSGNTDDIDAARTRFESDTSSYVVTLNSQADRLTQYVFAVSAAIQAASTAGEAASMRLDFPIDPARQDPNTLAAGANPNTSGSIFDEAEVLIVAAPPATLGIVVPAPYFYALGVTLSASFSPDQRYQLATFSDEAQLLAEFQQAMDHKVIVADPLVPPDMAARRLAALGVPASLRLPVCPVNPEVTALLNGWLAFGGADISTFWDLTLTDATLAAGQVDLVLAVLIQQTTPSPDSLALIAAIRAIPVDNVQQLEARTDTDWENFFGNAARATLLPPFTAPGTTPERVAAFIRQLRKFLNVGTGASPAPIAPAEPVAGLPLPVTDAFTRFVIAYDFHTESMVPPKPAFSFAADPDPAAVNWAIEQVFPGDEEACVWLGQSLRCIHELYTVTAGPDDATRFSFVEALYARGFTSKASIAALSEGAFSEALTGTVAYPSASVIYTAAGGTGGSQSGDGTEGKFQPVNPDGSLVNCLPPWHLSPLGPVEYLHELLELSARSTCEHPFAESEMTLAVLLKDRRGPLGRLHATAANVETPLPLLDLVNENLEALASGATAGVVYDTAAAALDRLPLRRPNDPKEGKPFRHDPATLFAAQPEYSSPAAPTALPGAYDNLQANFSAPVLPYAQPLDVSRSFLRALGTSRCETMRTFRARCTEFALDPEREPSDFQSELWRYPVRIEIACECLGISPQEYEGLYTHDLVTSPTAGHLAVWEVYGFAGPGEGAFSWKQIVVRISEFLRRTGLTYCEFLELCAAKFVEIRCVGARREFPPCEPCCTEGFEVGFAEGTDPVEALGQLAVFIRLWRTLREVNGARYTFTQLADICQVLGLFVGGRINPDFIRQLAAFQTLRDDLRLALLDRPHAAAGATGAARTGLLALWEPAAPGHDGAVDYLLGRIETWAEARHTARGGEGRHRRDPKFIKILRANLPALSILAGFDPGTPAARWDARPTGTLRFAEVLEKLYLSHFTTGEVLYLFTRNTHLDGDDPFPEQDANEASDHPLDLPEEDHPFGLWELRRALLEVEIEDEEAGRWTWPQMARALRKEFGYAPTAGSDPFESLGQHFFPETLSHQGVPVSVEQRRYRTPLATANPGMWNQPPHGQFQYDETARELFTRLPMRDEAVVAALAHLDDPLPPDAARAVQQLYFGPRADLAPFALIFADFTEAEHRLIEEPQEHERWRYFQRAFALFHARCKVIARHLAGHVARETCGGEIPETLAWAVLRSLLADENFAAAAAGSWEKNSGVRPATFWPLPGGGAFAALLGLAGTGLQGTFSDGRVTVWEEVRGPMRAFGHARDKWNTPFPTILPAIGFGGLPPGQLQGVLVRNGLARRDSDGRPLGGVEGFEAVWSGVLLVEQPGTYVFEAGVPTPEGEQPGARAAEGHRWHVRLQRGEKRFILLNRHWNDDEAPPDRSHPVHLKRGAYAIKVHFAQQAAAFVKPGDDCPRFTGFEVKYRGHDTGGNLETLPIRRLYREKKTAELRAQARGEGDAHALAPAAVQFLAQHYTSTLRDIRRTYQRAFKALLFSHRLGLSAHLVLRHSQSELGYLLGQPELFEGTSAYAGTPYVSHHAGFDFNFLPVADPYDPPDPARDQRARPSPRRQQAMFDWFERLFDYTVMRDEVWRCHGRTAWLLFAEAQDQQPANPTGLLFHLGIDAAHAPLLFQYFPGKTVGWQDLLDERWALRVWHADAWVRRLQRHFVPLALGKATPSLWAGDDAASLTDGNANLTAFYRDGCVGNAAEPRRYQDLQRLDDGLRERARAALLAYLWGTKQMSSKDLGALLLQDVQTGLCRRLSRVEEAITAVQLFVERARLGMEPSFVVGKAFDEAWRGGFADFRTWQACRRRTIYRENYVEWNELARARRTDAFRFLESELRRSVLTIPVAGGLEYWPAERPPAHPSLPVSQHAEPASLRQFAPVENLGRQGLPERDARPSWLAPSASKPQSESKPETDPARVGRAVENVAVFAGEETLPLWLQAAVRLGTRFLRVAAAGTPPAVAPFAPRDDGEGACCCSCGKAHPPIMDEYYFWLEDSRHYIPPADGVPGGPQDADWGVTPTDPTSDWERPDKLPGLLQWAAKPMVCLAWCRVHNQEFLPPRRSADGAFVTTGADVNLQYLGRTGDSLKFSITGADDPPVGYADPSDWGFRYDIASDAAVVLPLVQAPPAPPPPGPFPGGLAAYPYFIAFMPGGPLQPSLFSAAVTVANVLRTHCRYEAALRWYELFHRPLQADNRWSLCERVELPARDGERALAVQDPEPRPENPCCQTENVPEAAVRRRAVLLDFLETLAQSGESIMRCHPAPEGFQKARLLYETMADVLGARPVTIQARDESKDPLTVEKFAALFAPLNPRLLALYGVVADRLGLLRRCETAQRLPERPGSYWGEPAGPQGCAQDEECCCPSTPYRFLYLVQKAQESAGDVRALGAELLSAYKEGDAEYLAAMRAGHERRLLDLTREIRQNEWRDADWQMQALQKNKESAQTRRQYFAGLHATGLIATEIGYLALTTASTLSRTAANVDEATSVATNMIPDPYVGGAGISSPVAVFLLPPGSKAARSTSAAARILNTVADVTGTAASVSLTEAGWERRDAEWVETVAELDIQIESIDRQILGAERRRDIALRQLNNLVQQQQQAAEVQDFLRDKFSNHALFLHLQQETAALHHQLFEVALCWARQAQRAYNLERGYTEENFLPAQPWDSLHEGLVSGERLQLALRRMEKSYADLNVREYELTKHFSLRLHFPLAFLRLKTTGCCEIDLPEWMFDLDYPGQYMRRARNIGVTVPCVSGPYTGVHCRLTVLSSTTRISPALFPLERCCHDGEHCCPECARAEGYRAVSGADPRFRRQEAATEAVATSSGINDHGMFELNFRDERYLPFEYAGAVCRIRLELPPENNQFDLETLSDFLVHLSYTAREGGGVLRRAACEAAQCCLPGGGLRYFDLAQDFSDAWQRFHGRTASHSHGRFELRLNRGMFPFLTGHREVRVVRLWLYFAAAGAMPPGGNHVVEFLPERHLHHPPDQACDCVIPRLTCVASEEWPCFYQGTLEVELGPLSSDRHTAVGAFHFPEEIGLLERAYLVCAYEALPAACCHPRSYSPDVAAATPSPGRW